MIAEFQQYCSGRLGVESSGRAWLETKGESARHCKRGDKRETQELPFLGFLEGMMVKSDLLKQISHFRPHDVPLMKPILFWLGPVRNQEGRLMPPTR